MREEDSGLNPRDVFYLYHFAIDDARFLFEPGNEGVGRTELFPEKRGAGCLIDYTDGNSHFSDFNLDSCLDLNSGKRRPVRYPLALPGCPPVREVEERMDSTTDVLAVKYRLGSNIRTLYFSVTFALS